MIVDPDFFTHWRTGMLIDALGGDQMAPLYVLRIWAHCQTRKSTSFDMPAAGIKALCKFSGIAADLERALIEAGFIERDGSAVSVPKWADHNSKLIAAWNNGANGGRPKNNPAKTQDKPNENPTETEPKAIGGEEDRSGYEELSDEGEESVPKATRAGAICLALKAEGIFPVAPSHPRLLKLIEADATVAEFLDAVPRARGKRNAFEYLLGVVEGRRQDAAACPLVQGSRAPPAKSFRQKDAEAAEAIGRQWMGSAAPRRGDVIDMEDAGDVARLGMD